MLDCIPSNSKCEWRTLAPLVDEERRGDGGSVL